MEDDQALSSAEWDHVWRSVAARIAQHRAAGRAHLLTEDTVRMETVLALAEVGVAPSRLATEHPAPELAKGKLDLVVDPPHGAVVELKYPRDSRTGFSPDTMTLGELLRDFLRVAVVSARERWVVQVLNPRLQRYLLAVGERYALRWVVDEGDDLTLDPEVLRQLPRTATDAIGDVVVTSAVTARCAVAAHIDGGLTLYAYRVDSAAIMDSGRALQREESYEYAPVRLSRGARQEILAAVARFTGGVPGAEFTMPDIIREMRGSRYAETTIRTMISHHMCADVPLPGSGLYDDLERVDRGIYRVRRKR